MTHFGANPSLSPRSVALLGFIADAANSGAPSPSDDEMVIFLQQAGFSIPPRVNGQWKVIGYELDRLRRTGRLNIVGKHARRRFIIASTGNSTATAHGRSSDRSVAAAYANAARRRAEAEGWPVVTATSARSYNAAVARRLFAVDDMPPRRSFPVFVATRYAPVRSEVGCSAALAAL